MAFFCEKRGVRIVAPGICLAAGGTVPEFRDEPAHHAGEAAAAHVLASVPGALNDITKKSAVAAATETIRVFPDAPEAPRLEATPRRPEASLELRARSAPPEPPKKKQRPGATSERESAPNDPPANQAAPERESESERPESE